MDERVSTRSIATPMFRLFTILAWSLLSCVVGCAVDAELAGLPCPCASGYRCILQTCQPDPLVRDPSLVRWTDVEPGESRLPTITINDSIYPDEEGVRFLINGQVDLRSPTTRPNGFDPTGPREESTYHIHPEVDLLVGDELEAHWRDRNQNWRASVFVVGGLQDDSTNPATFTEVYALFLDQCGSCHTTVAEAGDLDFRTQREAYLELVGKPAEDPTTLSDDNCGDVRVVPNNVGDSVLVQRVRGTCGEQMPKGRTPLSEEQIRRIESWIHDGAPDN